MPNEIENSGSASPAGSDLLHEIAAQVTCVSDEAGIELEVLYFLGIDFDGTEDASVAIGLSTPHGHAYLIEDRFHACWLILHRSGTSGVIHRISEPIGATARAEECCRFLGLVHG